MLARHVLHGHERSSTQLGAPFTVAPASGKVGAVRERRLDVPVGVRPACVNADEPLGSLRCGTHAARIIRAGTVRAVAARAAAVAAGRGLPALAQEGATTGAADGRMARQGARGNRREGRQRSAAEQVLQERIEPPVVADVVSAEQISRVGDSTVSLALRRLPAVTVVDDQYIYVRGLGERYSSTTLNGANVPSPDLTRNVIPLDLFPSEIVESLKVQKGYSPDKPAAFGGGNVDIRTRSMPERLVPISRSARAGTPTARATVTRIRAAATTARAPMTALARCPARSRAQSSFTGDISPPASYARCTARAGSTRWPAEQVNRDIALNLNRNLDLRKQSLDPDVIVEAALGNSWNVGEGGDWRVGGLAVVDYDNQWRNRERINRSATIRTSTSTYGAHDPPSHATGTVTVGLDLADEQHLQATGSTCATPRTRPR